MPTIMEHKQYDAVVSGELAGSGTATQGPDIPCRAVVFTAVSSNTGKVYLGGAAVTAPDGVTDTTSGIELQAGDMTPFFPVSNLNKFFYICSSSVDDLCYLALR